MKKIFNKKGFTLIELIVVIAIIGILAAILIPQFTGYQEKARQKAAISEARDVATAIGSYLAEASPNTLSGSAIDLSTYTSSSTGTVADIGSYLGNNASNYGSIAPNGSNFDASNFIYTNKAGTYIVTVTNGVYSAAKK